MAPLIPLNPTIADPMTFFIGVTMIAAGAVLGGIWFGPMLSRSRFNVTLIAGLTIVGAIAALGWRFDVPGYAIVVSAVLWCGIWLYVLGTLLWLGLKGLGLAYYSEPEPAYGHEDIQIRIMTIDAQAVVQETVDALPATITDRHVIAESEMEIDGATVHVVPPQFSCAASKKGRALEWARRNLPCSREHILYLDEVTIGTDFAGLPEADIVQFGERPYRTGAIIPYLAEMFRLGFQLEQRTFGVLPVPLYAWGGGIAIRTSLEERVTWNYDTLIEDTVFTWRAVTEYDASFVALRTSFYNQAPASIKTMLSQRRRWIGGAEGELWRLPWYYRPVFKFRNFVWGMTPLASVIPFVTLLFPGLILFEDAYLRMSFVLLLTPLLWSILGYAYFEETHLVGALSVPFTPLITVVHSIGAFIGLLSKPHTFETTTKVGDIAGSTEYPSVSDGGLSTVERIRYQSTLLAGSTADRIVKPIKNLYRQGWRVITTGETTGLGMPFERQQIELQPAFILAMITAVGAVIRFYGLAGASYWVDEIYSVTVRGQMDWIGLLTAPEPHPPLYFAMLKVWMGLFGTGEFAVRSLSALFGVGSIIALYFICKELFDRSAGYVGATLMALSVFNIHASQTARMYEPLVFFTAVSLYYMLSVMDEGGYKNGVLYTLSAIAVLFTHLFGGFVILAQNIYVLEVLLAERDGRWERLKRWFLIELFVSAVYLSVLLTVLLPELLGKASGDSKAAWVPLPTVDYTKEAIMAIGGAPFQYPISDFSAFTLRVSWAFLAFSAAAVVFGTFRYQSSEKSPLGGRLKRAGGRGKLLGVVLFICTFVLPLALSYVITPIFVIRYLAPATVGAFVVIAGAVATIRHDAVRIAVMLGLIVTSAGLIGVYHQTETNENWESASKYITNDGSTDSLILFQPAWISKSLTYYGIPPGADVAGVYAGDYDFGPSGKGDMNELIRTHETIYVVRRHPSEIASLTEKITPTHDRVGGRDLGIVTVDKFVREKGDVNSTPYSTNRTQIQSADPKLKAPGNAIPSNAVRDLQRYGPRVGQEGEHDRALGR
jgi:hypothetical protein